MACEDWTEPKKNLCWLKRKSIDADETGHPSDFSLEQMDGRMLSTVELLSFRTIKSGSCYTVSRRGYHRGTQPFTNRNAAFNALPGHLTASPPLNISSFRCHAAASNGTAGRAGPPPFLLEFAALRLAVLREFM